MLYCKGDIDGTQCTVGYYTYVQTCNCVCALVYIGLEGKQCTVGYTTYVQPRN